MDVHQTQQMGSSERFPFSHLVQFSLYYLLIALLLLPHLPIGGSSEAREAKVIDVIVSTGEWVLPLRNGVVPSKPPLFHWIGASLAMITDAPPYFISEFDARLPSVIAGLITVWLVTFVTFRFLTLSPLMVHRSNAGSIALLTAAILSLTYGFYQMSTMAMVDMVFTMFLWSALAGLATVSKESIHEEGVPSSSARILFWLGCACAVVARGPIGAVLPVLLVGTFGVFTLGISRTVLQLLKPSVGWVFFLLPAAWYFAAFQRGGEAFIDRQLVFENIRRVVGGEHMNTEPWWFYLPSLARTTFPWWLLCLYLVVRFIPGSRANFLKPYKGPEEFTRCNQGTYRFLPLLCFFSGVLLFSIPSGKRHSYLLSLLPFVALQISVLLSEVIQREGLSGRVGILKGVNVIGGAASVMAILFVGGIGLFGENIGPMTPLRLGLQPFIHGISLPLAALLSCGVLPLLSCKNAPFALQLKRVWFGLFVLISSIVCVGLGVKSSIKDYPGLARRVAQSIPAGHTLSVVKDPFEEYFDPLMFYLRRDVAIVNVNSQDLPCEDRVVYIAKTVVLEAALPRYRGKVSALQIFREFGDEIHNNRSREFVAYTCDATTPPESPSLPSGGGDVVAWNVELLG